MNNLTQEQRSAVSLFTCWWAMHEAQAEVTEDPFNPDAVALNFMGSGASCMVMVKHLRAVCDVLSSLAAPSVASSAPADELPPCAMIYSGARFWSEDQILTAVLAEREAIAHMAENTNSHGLHIAEMIRARN